MTARSDGGGAGGTVRDDGAGTIWVLCVCAAVWSVTLALLAFGGVAMQRHQAAAAADLAALAAADQLLAGNADVCGRARVVAAAQRARLTSCQIDAGAMRVWVTVVVSGPRPVLARRLGLPPVSGRAVAGASQELRW